MWKKVVAPTLVVSLLWVAVSVISTYHFQQIYDAHTRTLAENVTTIDAAWAMRRDLWKLQAAIEGAQNDLWQAKTQFSELEASFRRSLVKAERTSLTPQEQALVKLILERFNAYREHVAQMFRGEPTSPIRLSTDDRHATFRLASDLGEACRDLLKVNQDLIDVETARSRDIHANLNTVRVSFLIAGPLLGLVLGLWIARGLHKSLTRIRITLQDATGQLGCDLGSIAVTDADDLPALQRQLQSVGLRIRQVVDELESARQRALRSERLAAVGELAAGVAHEIRNPLTSVKLLIQNAARRPDAHALNERGFEIILHEILRIENTIQALLDFARPSSLRPVLHDMRVTLQRSLNLVQARAEQQRVTIAVELPTQPLAVRADPEQLQVVFDNLSINAIEAMPCGGTLNIVATHETSVVRVVFSDTGGGIPATLLDRIFEPFVTGKERGTGLGLAISRRIVEEHAGTVTAANRASGGAVLTIELPAVAEPLAKVDPTPASGVAQPDGASQPCSPALVGGSPAAAPPP